MTDPAKITWPGIDKQRAGHALAHMRAALIATINSRYVIAKRHVVEARGYLGAIGFEKKSRVLVRDA